jgi:hypothetical protein
MPRLIVANVDGLAMSGSPRDDEDYRHSAMAAERLLVFLSEGDLIVLPQAPSEAFLTYSNTLLGRRVRADQIIVPRQGREEGLIWSYEALNSSDLYDQVRARAGAVDNWELLAFFLDRPVLAFADALDLRLPGGSAGFLRAGGAESLNSKAVFREMAESTGVPVAPGAVVGSAAELAHQIERLITETGSVIVKQDVNLGGVGNAVLTLMDRDEFAGSRITIKLPHLDALPAVADRLWPRVASGLNTKAIVETYYADARPLCCELFAHGRDSLPEVRNFGEMLMSPVFVGLELHSGTLGEVDAAVMVAQCVQLAHMAAGRGFHGYLNIDSLLTSSGEILVNEINGRMGGCTHIDEWCRVLVGPDYAQPRAGEPKPLPGRRLLPGALRAGPGRVVLRPRPRRGGGGGRRRR